MKSEILRFLLDAAATGDPSAIARDCQTFLKQYKSRRLNTEPSERKNFKKKDIEKAWIRQGGKCARCGEFVEKSEMVGDHRNPVIGGGLTKPSNLDGLCTRCNSKKGGRDFVQDVKKTGRTVLERVKLSNMEEEET